MSQPTIASVERELVECQQECGRLIGQLREARAQAYEQIAEHINKPFACPLCKEELEAFYKHHCSPGNETLSPMQSLRIWLRSESKRIRESK